MKRLRITVDGKAYDVTVEVLGESRSPGAPGPFHPTESPAAPGPTAAPPAASPAGACAFGDILSPMAGTVFKIPVKPGDLVRAGQPLLILEAMKMETPVAASADATVREILVKEGEAVQEGQALLRLE